MESMESHEAGFPPFPHSLEIPSGLPHFHGLDDWVYVFSCPLYSNHRYRKGLVTDVSGPQRNACPGTLNGKERGRPLRAALIIRRRLRLAALEFPSCLRKRSTEPVDGQKHWHGPVIGARWSGQDFDGAPPK